MLKENFTKEDFIGAFKGRFWEKLGESIVYHTSPPKSKDDFLSDIYDCICNYEFSPNCPRAYLILNKHNYVARIVPVFDYKEHCIYYWCVKQLEEDIKKGRIEGTYGGWQLSHPIRKIEEEEEENIKTELEYNSNTENPFYILEEWREFMKKAYLYSLSGETPYKYMIKFDISNFYDTINLTKLEEKLRFSCTKSKNYHVINLLIHFLKNWNKHFENYSPKTVGIPQDEQGDCSRILANFYLQTYDGFMKENCEKRSMKYLRYSDDQIIYANNKEEAIDMLFLASKELFRYNLNLNSSKIKEFNSIRQWEEYWGFELFTLLKDKDNTDDIREGVDKFIDYKNKGLDFRWTSVLKRIISLGLEKLNISQRGSMLDILCEESFIIDQKYWLYHKIAQVLNTTEREPFFDLLDLFAKKARFNSYLYELIKFYEKYEQNHRIPALKDRILEISI